MPPRLSIAAWLGVAAVAACSGAQRGKTPREEPRRIEISSNVRRADYVGSESCAACHPREHEAWQGSPMRRMTRALAHTETHAPFDGAELRLRGDRAVMLTANDRRFVRIDSRSGASSLFRVTKVIGGRYREDFVGLEVPADDPGGAVMGEERVLPISYLIWNRSLRYKGYSVQVHERDALEPGVVWRKACIFCHNTTSELSTLYDDLHGARTFSYQGSVSNELPKERAFRYEISDSSGLRRALTAELEALGVQASFDGDTDEVALRRAARATDARFGEDSLLELGIGCEACHGGAREHVNAPATVMPSLSVRSDFFSVTDAQGGPLSHAQNVNRVCAKCHTVLFSRYPFTWEGGVRRRDPGGSTINSGEGRDFLLSRCSSALACTNCHDPHGEDPKERLLALARPEGNATCTRCHGELRSDSALSAHTHHPPRSEGSACVACHMPRKNMGLAYELTRYHRIGSPTDRARVEGDRPLECALCHADKSVDQIVSTMERFWGKRYDRAALKRLYGADLGIGVLRATLTGGKPHEVAVAAAVAAERGRTELLPLLVESLGGDYPLVRYFVHHAVERMTGAALDVDLTAPGRDVVDEARRALSAQPGSRVSAAR